jgi:UDP-glucose 4-epimerase
LIKKNFLVTGAHGFIGYNVLSYFKKKKINIKGLDNFSTKNLNFKKKNSIKIINCDILDKKKIKNIIKNFDVIIHLAAIENPNFILKFPDLTFDVNFYGTKNIVDNLSSKQLFIFFSSNTVYGNNSKLPLSEKSITSPSEIYGISKLLSENYIEHLSKFKNFKYFIIRNFPTFGPYQTKKSYIPTLINSALIKNKFEIFDAKKYRDLQYVEDLCENLFQLILMKNKVKKNIILNAASGNAYSSLFIAQTLKKLINVNFTVKKNNSNKIKKLKRLADIKNFRKILKRKYKISTFNKSLLKTIDFYKNYQ